MPKNLVSVIVPCYNIASYIEKCIYSVFAQTYSNFEIIVIDDESTDNTEDIISGFIGNNKIRYFRISHSGVSSARNFGIEKAKGDYILFIDGDDWIDSNHLSTLVKGASKCDCPIIRMRVEKEGESSTSDNSCQSNESWKILSKEEFNKIYESYLLSSPCNKLYRSDLIHKHNIKFREDISYAEDLIFNLNYFKFISTSAIGTQATYHYIKHPVQSGTTRYHKNVVATLDSLSTLTHDSIENLTEKTLAIEMQHYLWGILNVFHKSANLSRSQRYNEIKLITNLKWWKQYKKYLPRKDINSLLYYLLMYGNPFLIEWVLSKRKF